MTDTLTLFCLVDGETTLKAFPVDISSTGTVGHLKKLIKAEKAPRFDDVAADELTLWQVSIPSSDDDDDEEVPVALDKLNEKKKLSPAKLLSRLFVHSPPDETVHIFIQRPPSAAQG
ncbi:hypothetical protein BGZ70_000572 [Mortierella alpina]|uniref:Crinkler effector protein N-terminal domain-containing protein n=1 Tax=Mortierella alpina TaxID=64518 RepID=A0A9P6IXN4_MORAP|nr:hypothetical protein BGZ70_000572 [Mortierella alpina]